MGRRTAIDKVPFAERTLFDYAYAAVAESGGKNLPVEDLLAIASGLRAADLVDRKGREHMCSTCGRWHGQRSSWSNIVSIPERVLDAEPRLAGSEIEEYFSRFRSNVRAHYGVELRDEFTERRTPSSSGLVDVERVYEEVK